MREAIIAEADKDFMTSGGFNTHHSIDSTMNALKIVLPEDYVPLATLWFENRYYPNPIKVIPKPIIEQAGARFYKDISWLFSQFIIDQSDAEDPDFLKAVEERTKEDKK